MITASAQSSYPGRYTPISSAAQAIKDKGVRVYSIGVGPGVDDQELNDIASRPQHVYKVPYNRLRNFGATLWNKWRDHARTQGKSQ